VGRARKLVAFTRLLARLESPAPKRWVLKGGFALELRLGGQARRHATSTSTGTRHLKTQRRRCSRGPQSILTTTFSLRSSGWRGGVGAVGGIRFRADALVAGRLFEQLLIDVGSGKRPSHPPTSSPPLTYSTSPVSNLHVFSRLHSSNTLQRSSTPTRRRYADDRPSSRPKDLIDMVLIAELAWFEATKPACGESIACSQHEQRTWRHKSCQPPPVTGLDLTGRWHLSLKSIQTLAPGYRQAAQLLDPLLQGEVGGTPLESHDAAVRTGSRIGHGAPLHLPFGTCS